MHRSPRPVWNPRRRVPGARRSQGPVALQWWSSCPMCWATGRPSTVRSRHSTRGDGLPRTSWRSPSRHRIGPASSPRQSRAGQLGGPALRRRFAPEGDLALPPARRRAFADCRPGRAVHPEYHHIADATVISAAVRRLPEGPARRRRFAPEGDLALPPAQRRAPAGCHPGKGSAPSSPEA